MTDPSTEKIPRGSPMPGRGHQVKRIYTALGLLEASPWGLTIRELTERMRNRGFEDTDRSLRRDLEVLSEVGFPLYEEEDGETRALRWKLQSTTRINGHLVLSSRELLALYFARGALTPLKETPFYQDLESIFSKIEAQIGDRGRRHLQSLQSQIGFEPGPRWGLGITPDLLETVQACCAERQVLRVTYASVNSQDRRARKLGPQFLYFAKGSLYLLAEDLAEGKVKIFSLPRMSDAEMMEEAYDGALIDPEEYFRDTFGIFKGDAPVTVKLECSAKVAPYLRERRWHPSQTIVARERGAILLQLEVALTPELVQWVLGFGTEIRVKEPKELKRKILSAATGLVRLYDKEAA